MDDVAFIIRGSDLADGRAHADLRDQLVCQRRVMEKKVVIQTL